MFKFIKRYICSIIFTLVIVPIFMVVFILGTSKDLIVRLLTWNTKEKYTLEELLTRVDDMALSIKGWITEAAVKNGETK